MASSGAPENADNGRPGQLDTNFSFPTGSGSAPVSPAGYREPLPLMETVIQKRQRSRSKSKEAGRTQPGPKSLMDLIALTISMAGAQVTWTVELGYGTPFLRDLGLSSTLTSLVWLAGPLSGLIAQPLIGAVSDSSTSKYRRRYWVAMSTMVLFVAALGLAFAIPFARGLVSLFNPEPPVPDRQWDNSVRQTAIGIAVFCFYLLDFALNALQASLRNLLLDVTPAEQLTTANAWHGRMIHAGNIVGFALGGVVLENWPVLRWFGGDQFRKVCIVTMVVLAVTVWITLVTQEEREKELGICWAVACWVPFAIIMEYLKEMDDSAKANRVAAAVADNTGPSTRPGHNRVYSTPAHPVRRLARSTSGVNPNERTVLLRRYSMNMTENEMYMTELNVEGSGDVAGGTILGIHNLAIVLPQFFVSIASSIIFKIFDGSKTGDTLYLGKHGVSWVLRFGGVIALIGAAISRRVPPTKTEKAMRKRWAEIQEEEDAGTP
ncbi:hypothetical protein RSAG8_00725, partial [Rhizoctonia solani AG-8 WAC10335]